MGLITIPQESFTGGEWAPSLYARSNLEKYATAVKTLRNFFPHPHGPASNRPGLEFIVETKTSADESYLIPFEFSVVQAYLIEAGDQYMRFVKDGGQIVGASGNGLDIIKLGKYYWLRSGSGTAEYYLLDREASAFNIVNTGIYKWVESPAKAGEYYLTTLDATDPDIDEPDVLFEDVNGDDTLMTAGTVGSLTAGSWDYGNNDGLGYNTIYVKLTDGSDPDTQESGYLQAYYEENGDPELDEPVLVYEDVGSADTQLSEGTLGSLAAGEWGYGDNDSLGFDTIYIRLTDGADPNSKDDGYLEAAAVADGSVYELTTPYAKEDVPLLKFTQSADTLYIMHPSYARRKLSRGGHAYWTLKLLGADTPIAAPTNVAANGAEAKSYVVTAVGNDGEESVMSSPDLGADDATITWTPVANAEYYNVYKDGNSSGMYGWIGKASKAGFTNPSGGIDPDYSKTPPVVRNPFDSTDSYPGVAAFFQQRLISARTNKKPQDIWGSRTALFENMNISSPLQDDDAFNFTINAQQVNEIRWLVPLSKLLVGTSGGVYTMVGGGTDKAITPSSVSIDREGNWGVSDVQPLVVGKSVLFIGRSGDIVREIAYTLESDGYDGADLSILANHLFKGYTLTQWAYQENPDSIIWCIRNDGTLLGLTFHKEHQVWGWHHHDTEGSFESVAVLPSSSGDDEVYFIVNRTINGTTKRYIERMKSRMPLDDTYKVNIKDAFFVDCGLSLDSPIDITAVTAANPVVVTAAAHGLSNGDLVDIVEVEGMTELNGNRYKVANKSADTFELTDPEDDSDIDGSAFTVYTSGGKVRKAVTTISGLSHLEGEAVAVLADGVVVEGKTVSSGAISLTTAASRVHVGLPYTCDLETLNRSGSSDQGTIQDLEKDIPEVTIHVENAYNFAIGPDEDNLDEHTFDSYDDDTGLFTGHKDVSLNSSGVGNEARVFIRVSDPLPITVMAIYARVTYGDA